MIANVHSTGKIILASASPRRRALLSQIGAVFEALSFDVEEVHGSFPPDELVLLNSERKADAAFGIVPGNFIIGADTLVYSGGGIVFGKPRDTKNAFEMLTELSGARHTVYTGVCIISPTGVRTRFFESADVFMRSLSDEEIHRYIKTGEPMDKAGAYGIQGLGSILIERICGDYYTVVGLPVCRLFKELEKLGYRLF